jgi:hypothetical protein
MNRLMTRRLHTESTPNTHNKSAQHFSITVIALIVPPKLKCNPKLRNVAILSHESVATSNSRGKIPKNWGKKERVLRVYFLTSTTKN